MGSVCSTEDPPPDRGVAERQHVDKLPSATRHPVAVGSERPTPPRRHIMTTHERTVRNQEVFSIAACKAMNIHPRELSVVHSQPQSTTGSDVSPTLLPSSVEQSNVLIGLPPPGACCGESRASPQPSAFVVVVEDDARDAQSCSPPGSRLTMGPHSPDAGAVA